MIEQSQLASTFTRIERACQIAAKPTKQSLFPAKTFGDITGEITGRNWSFEHLTSYIVRAKIGGQWQDVPVGPDLKAQIAL